MQKQQSLRSLSYHATEPLRVGECYYSQHTIHDACTPQYALVYLSQGCGLYVGSSGNEYEVEPGQAFQRFPDESHRIEYSKGSRAHFVAVPYEVYSLMKGSELPTLRTVVLSPGKRCGFVQRQRKLTAQLRDEQAYLLMRTLTDVQQLIIDIHMLCLPKLNDYAALVEQGCRVLSGNFQSEVRAEDVAESVGLSYSLFRKVFREITGISPGGYRLQRRLDKAQELLLLGYRVGEVAMQLGYNDVYTFSAQFKKHRGVSPSEYVLLYSGE